MSLRPVSRFPVHFQGVALVYVREPAGFEIELRFVISDFIVGAKMRW